MDFMIYMYWSAKPSLWDQLIFMLFLCSSNIKVVNSTDEPLKCERHNDAWIVWPHCRGIWFKISRLYFVGSILANIPMWDSRNKQKSCDFNPLILLDSHCLSWVLYLCDMDIIGKHFKGIYHMASDSSVLIDCYSGLSMVVAMVMIQ